MDIQPISQSGPLWATTDNLVEAMMSVSLTHSSTAPGRSLLNEGFADDSAHRFGEGDEEHTAISALPFDLNARFTGRAEPIARLTTCMDKALDGGGLGFAAVVGPAGMGKSRIIAELIRRAKAAHPSVQVLAGTADEVSLPYGPVARALASRFGLVPGESDDLTRERIVAGVAEALPATRVVEIAHLLAHVLRVPYSDSPVVGPLALAPQRLETRAFMAIRRLLAADAAAQPLVLAFEDLERCGADTINLIHYLAAGLANSPVLIVVTATGKLFERHPTFGDGDVSALRLDLGPLSSDEAERLIRTLLAPIASVPARIVGHARDLGGSPRALHELVRLLLESDCVVRGPDGSWRIDEHKLELTALPRTYDQLVATRLAVMDVGLRRTLEMAATVGATSWLDALVAVDRTQASTVRDPDGPTLAQIAATEDESRATITAAVAKLIEREWLAPVPDSSLAGERELRFAYPHLWNLVYAGIENGRRRSYHATVARWLELRASSADSEASAPEAIARHLELAGEERAAAGRFRRAAEAARAHYRNEQAIRLFDRALACIGDADIAARISLWHDLGSVYHLIGDFEAALGAFERMLRLSWLAASKTKAAVAFNKMGRVWRRKGDLTQAIEYLERGLELFRTADDARGVAGSLDDIGKTQHLRGNYDEAYQKVTEALARRGAVGDPRSIAASLSNLGAIQHDRGQFEAAATCHREALELRQAASDRSGVVASHNDLASLAFELGDWTTARAQWVIALADAEAIGALPMSAVILTHLGELALGEGKLDEARGRLENALEIIEDIEDRRLETECCRHLAVLESRQGKTSAACELAKRALAAATKAGLREKEAQCHLTLGEIAGANLFVSDSGDNCDGGASDTGAVEVDSPAAGHFRQAESILRAIGNRTVLGKVLEAFGRHLLERGQRDDGRTRLREAHEIFAGLGLVKPTQTVEALLAST